MFKKFLKFLLYVLVIALISGAVIAGFLVMGKPLEQALIVVGVLLALWFLYVIIRKLIIRARAKQQVQRVLQEEDTSASTDLGMSEKTLQKELRNNWQTSVKALKKSQLKLRGDPLYVLPWFMVFGKPSSGKSTSLRSAKLLSPKIDFPEHADGSTLNLEWWLYEEAIVIDTAGRYAVPDVEKRDRQEWRSMLRMLASHKQKEPISGLVIVIAADRLLNNTEDQLLEEGRQLRASLSDLMGCLEAKPPVYLMITKCDLIAGFSEWCDYLPATALRQPMGYLNEEEGGTLDEIIDTSLDVVLARMKELRLLMLERSHNTSDCLLTLPVEMEKLRSGLHIFSNTALKENVYQETPRFRGMYFSSSLRNGSVHDENVTDGTGAFLQQFYTRILPSDRGMTDNLAAAVRFRNAIKKYSVSIGGAVTVLALLLLSSLYANDLEELERIKESHRAIKLNQNLVNLELGSLYRLRELINKMDSANAEWIVPWTGTFKRPAQVQELVDRYNESFATHILTKLDEPLKKRIATLKPEETSVIAGGIVRRINMLKTRMAENPEELIEDLPDISSEYVVLLERTISDESADYFNELYMSYLTWNSSPLTLAAERATLQSALLDLLSRNQGDYGWIIDWANSMGGEPVRLSDFWGGATSFSNDLPVVEPAFTLEGRDTILAFLHELEQASDDSGKLTKILSEFDEFYERKYVKSWAEFAKRFDEGQKGLSGKKDWLTAVERMASEGNPYFTLMERIHFELEPITYDDDFQARNLVDYFYELKTFAGAESEGGNGKGGKTALKLLGKAGKVGKMAAKVGKKALKAKKKMKGKSPEQLESMLETAAAAFGEYKTSLTSVAFSAESRPQSLSAVASLFTAPDSPGSGSGSVAEAEKSVMKLQMMLGKPSSETRIFWDLYTGPIRVSYEFMREEASCHLQDQWEKTVLAELEGVSRSKIGNALIGDGGLVWSFIDSNSAAFLHKRHLSGFSPVKVGGRSIPWNESFLDFINNGSVGKNLVNGEYTVKLSSLPTGVNHSAKMSPYSAILELRCADGAQTLANYNYNSSQEFIWSLEKCGDVTLNVSIGQITLRKEYKGEKGFPEFLSDFRDGHRVFVAEEFPDVLAQLKNIDVRAIDVNYEITGQQPVVQIMKTVPLNAPSEIVACWD